MKNKLSERLKIEGSQYDRDWQLVRSKMSDGRPMKWKDLEAMGVARNSIVRLTKDEVLEKIGWGTYQLSYDHRIDPIVDDAVNYDGNLEDFQEVLVRAPRGVISHVTAARYHDLTEETPQKTWITIKHGTHSPKFDQETPVKVVVSRHAEATELGVVRTSIRGGEVAVTGLERTVVDIYKYASRLGDSTMPKKVLSKAIEKDGFDRDKLDRYAKAFRVDRKIRHDLETIDLVAKSKSGPDDGLEGYGLGMSM